MRSAELIGLTPNGKFVVVKTESGEELAIAADDRLRAALRGDRPRLGQLEIEMETALTPREIQTRIRAGEDVADVARVSGLTLDRVERFAAPVLAERDHVARQALSSTVRRRGETSANRNLRAVVNERLQSRGIETAQIDWDAFRQPDGRWVVTASYSSGGAERQAQFAFDPPGRFSIGGNDEAHWILGDSSASKGPQPGRRRPVPGEAGELGDDTEPTLDLSDELALVRVVQDAIDDEDDDEDEDGATGPAGPPPLERTRHWSGRADAQRTEDTVPVPELRVVEGGWEPPIVVNYPVEPGPPEDASDEPGRYDEPTDLEDRLDEEDAFEDAQVQSAPEPTDPVDSVDPVDAVETSHPVEQPTDDPEQPTERPIPHAAAETARSTVEPEDAAEHPVTQQPADSETGPDPDVEPSQAPPEPAKPNRRKRASVPSWDEIMFGGPGS